MCKQVIKNILISQPAPLDIEKSQYKILIDNHDVELTFNKFFDITGISNKEFRASKINILDHTAVIVTSKLAIDNYFKLAKELRLVIPESMKFFCVTEGIANYLQNYIQYRKRKIFYGKLQFSELIDTMLKHKEETFLYPCSDDTSIDNFKLLDKNKIKYTKSVMYRSVPKDLRGLDIEKFDMVVMFSPIGVSSFIESFPGYNHEKIDFAAFGLSTQAALKDAKIKTIIPAPTPQTPSMIMAIDRYLSLSPEERAKHKERIEEEFNKKADKKSSVTLKVTTKKTSKSKSNNIG
ncbi:MAG: uroporphyrinogen-III synthase [Bacteroidales bacterium]|nr:uroporphyrinogen-III synthase [Bacteroidales bacterium]MDD4684669.1 uroporphyrinogen-III synthase [Bacteroidales bacterium]